MEPAAANDRDGLDGLDGPGSLDRELAAKAHSDLGWNALLEQLAARTHTSRGMAGARSLSPSLDASWIRRRLAEGSEARTLHERGEPMAFGSIFELEDHLYRAEKGGHLDGNSLREVASTIEAGTRIRRQLLRHGGPAPATPPAMAPTLDRWGRSVPTTAAPRGVTPKLAARAALLAELPDVSGPILESFDDAGQLLDTASPALGPLRRKAAALREDLDKRVHALLDHPLIAPHLQDHFYTRREDRYVVPIRIDARTRVKGIVHGTSSSGQTVFVEPEEVVDLNNRLKLAELEVDEEERRILGELSRLVADAVRPLRANLEILAELDLIDAGARLAIDLRATEPALADLARALDDAPEVFAADAPPADVDLRKARHPLMVLAGRVCVPNDIVLRRGQTLVVSGPNAGGKTVALKTTGLLALMVRAGLHLPVQEGSSLPLYRTVLTDVGDDQSIERNLSTFSAHVLNLNRFLDAASTDTLVLLDEVAVGTDPEQGAALAQAVLEQLAVRGATVIVTTHYERLKAMAASNARFVNGSVGFDMEKLEPTYQLHLGVPGASGAIVVARRLGLPASIGARAEALLGQGSQHIEELLAEIERERRRLETLMAQAEAERVAAVRSRERAEELATEAAEKVKAARKAEHDESVEALKRARLELDRTRTLLRKAADSPTREAFEAAARAIDASSRAMQLHAPVQDAPGRPARPDELVTGAEVYVPQLGGIGKIAAPPRDGKVAVHAGALKLTVDAADLLIPSKALARASASVFVRGKVAARFDAASRESEMLRAAEAVSRSQLPRAPGNTLDLRGERVEDALARADKFLDESLRANHENVFFIHGHGTGALRNALREHLAGSPAVSTIRPGEKSEGGDGVTVATLS